MASETEPIEETSKSKRSRRRPTRKLWLIKWKDVWVPLTSVIVTGAVSVFSLYNTSVVQQKISDSQLEMKKFELFDKPKREGYTTFMRSIAMAHESAYKRNNIDDLASKLEGVQNAYFSIEPFLTDEQRTKIWDQIQRFSAFCYDLREKPLETDETRNQAADNFLQFKHTFRDELLKILFP